VQRAVKCRGREYLRIIYGPEYTAPEHLERLRSRGLGTKRSLALREFALGMEALQRFVEREPLRRVHECVFGVLRWRANPSIRGCELCHNLAMCGRYRLSRRKQLVVL
jgi:PNKP (polynucleotide 5'-kinase/3'-phosphatase) family adenylyltransferase-like protein